MAGDSSAAPASVPLTNGDPVDTTAPLLDLDPDLGDFLDADRAAAAHRALLVTVKRLAAGPWDTGAMAAVDAGHLGLLLLDGLLLREVVTDDVVSAELLGLGEVVRPWQLMADPALLRTQVRWTVLIPARVAVLDRRLATQLAAFPEVLSVVIERMSLRTHRIAVSQAIAQLNRVDRRLLTMFWHLAERWGRVTPHGTAVPLTLSHRMLAQLVGARRPSVSTALSELARSGEVARLPDGSWLLTGDPVGAPVARKTAFVAPRRRLHAAGVATGSRELAAEPMLVA
jgi:CRP/FNR family cyclic AMP-dependent transcriptional regulator